MQEKRNFSWKYNASDLFRDSEANMSILLKSISGKQ
jgi:hypothetical protein